MAVAGIAGLFLNLGLSTATIQRADINHAQVSTLFWINASMGFLMAGMLPVGALLGGLLGQALGLRATITLAAIGSLLSAGWILFSPVPGIRSIEKAGG